MSRGDAGIQVIRRESPVGCVTLRCCDGYDILTRAAQLYELLGGDGAGYDIVVWVGGGVTSGYMWASDESVL